MSKPKIIKHFNKLDLQLQTLIVSSFPRGFDKHLITFKGPKKKLISALPFETEEYSYFVKMSREEAIAIYTGETFSLEESIAILNEADKKVENIEKEIPAEVQKKS